MYIPARLGYGLAALALMLAPATLHGFEGEAGWADEYKRILRLFDDNLKCKSVRVQTR